MLGGFGFFEFKSRHIVQKYSQSSSSNLKLFDDDSFWCFYNLSENERFFADKNNTVFAIIQGKIRFIDKNKSIENIFDLYESYGENFIDYISGTFSIVLWDSKKKNLLLAVDLVGIKPVFYHYNERGILFSTSIKPLINCLNPSLNEKVVYNYLVFGFVLGEESIAKGVKLVPKSSVIIFTKGSLKIKKYHEVMIEQKDAEFDYYKKKINQVLFKAIQDYSGESDKVTVAFSGGLDSTIILSTLYRLGKDITAFSGILEGTNSANIKNIKNIAAKYCSNEVEIRIDEESIAKSFPGSIKYMEQPVSDLDTPMIFFVSKWLRNSPYIFGGKGADELYCSGFAYTPKNENAKKKVNENILFAIPFIRKSKIIENNSKRGAGLFRNTTKLMASISKFNSYTLNRQFFDLKFYINHEMSTVDSIYTKNKVKYIYPFFDTQFVDLSLKIPLAYKKRKNIDKYILRESFASFLPEEVYKTPKGSSFVPKKWITNNIDYKKIIGNSKFLKSYLNKEYIKGIIGKPDSQELIELLILDLWHNSFIESGGSSDG